MIITEFKKIIVPKEYQFLKIKTIFVIKYWIELNGKPFNYGKAFKNKDEVIRFCKENKITIEQLKKVWIGGKNA